MQKIVFEDTTVVKSPYVIIDGVEHEVYNGTYQGGTDLDAQTFNTMQNNIENSINLIDEKVNNLNAYSNTEKEIGTYDGKTVYRQIIEELVANQGEYKVIKNNVENLFSISVEIDNFSGTCYYLDSNPRVISLSKVNNEVRIKTESNVINGLVMIATIEYTKTTD